MKNITYRILSAVMVLAMVVGMLVVVPTVASAAGIVPPSRDLVWDGTTVSESLSGEGTEGSPYEINNAADFMYFYNVAAANATANTYFSLNADIYLNDETRSANVFSVTGPDFAGVFLGKNHSVNNAKVEGAVSGKIAFFNEVSGTIRDLSLQGFYVKNSTSSGSHHAALLATSLTGTLDNVHTKEAYVRSETSNAAGLVYSMGGTATIKNCSTDGEVSSNWHGVSGIVHYIYTEDTATGITISDCTNNMKLKACPNKDQYTAGIVSTVEKGKITITGCVNNAGTFVNANLPFGGIVGQLGSNYNSASATVSDCVNYADITTNRGDGAGGIVCRIYRGVTTIENCTNYGKINSSGGYAGGIVSTIPDGRGDTTLNGCVNYGTIIGTKAAGGMIGYRLNQGAGAIIISDSANFGTITSTDKAGGMVGYSTTSGQWKRAAVYVYNSANYGTVTATTATAGGVIGYAKMDLANGSGEDSIKVSGFVGIGDVTAPTLVGGVIGQFETTGLGRNMVAVHVFENLWLKSSVTATAEDGLVGILGGQIENTTEDKYKFNVLSNSNICLGDLVWYTDNNGNEVAVPEGGATSDASKFTDLSTSGALQSLNASATAGSYTPWAQGKTAPTLVTTLGISGATMSLSSNMALNMKLAASTLAGLTVTNVAFVDAEGNGINAVKDDLDRYSASYVKRAADMAEEMKLHLVITIAGTEYVSTNILTYSPLTYLTNLYADYTGEKQSEANATEVLDVVTAMLGYGAAAETKDSGATTIAAKMTALGITAPTFTEDYTDHISGVVTEDDKTAINNIAQVGATLTGGMELTFAMKNTAYTALSVADFGVFYADENGKITVTGINAAMILDTLSLTFTGDGVDGVSANFTVGDFLESRRDNADETALAEATILYMMAARAYVLN